MNTENDRYVIVSFSPNRWDDKWSSRQFVAREFARKGHIAIHVEPPVWFGQKARGGVLPECVQVEPNMWRYRHSVTLPQFGVRAPGRWLNTFTNSVRYSQLRRAIKRISLTAPIIYIWHPDFAHAVGRLDERLVCYHKYDRFPWTGNPTPEFRTRELELVNNAGACFSLTREMINLGERDVDFHVVPCAVDWQVFHDALKRKDQNEPADIQKLPHPRLGYVGAINQKVDFELLTLLAERLEQGCIVLVGPVGGARELYEEKMQVLLQHPRVHWLGSKKFNDIPSYIVHLDVGLMCYDVDRAPWMKDASPLKMYEYLAAGLPTISADLLAAEEIGDLLTIARTREEWWFAIQRALEERQDPLATQRRLSFAKQNSWENRVDDICCHIQRKLAQATAITTNRQISASAS